ncbi:MAG TPA: site-2 protease family protein, partial [Myxococcaceae bacterium]|nr:site-2 protease family protein [Myxococcaceae bacterium]
LGVLLTAHELAHLLAARIFGTRAVVFSFGVGPPLFGFRALGQRWAIGAVPFGGWLRLEGENPHDAARASGVPFAALSVGRRLAVFAAGPLGSWAVAVLLLAGLFVAGTHHPVGLVVGGVEPGSRAAHAGFRPGDRILSVDGDEIQGWSELVEALGRDGGPASVTVARGAGTYTLEVTPELGADGRARIGVRQLYAYERLPAGRALSRAVLHTGVVIPKILGEAGALLAQPWGGAARAHTAGALVWSAAEAAGRSADALVRGLAALSLALALFFLLPLPALDGGRMLLTLWEAAMGRPVDGRVQTLLQTLSLVAGVAAVAWLAYGEVRQVLSVTLSR